MSSPIRPTALHTAAGYFEAALWRHISQCAAPQSSRFDAALGRVGFPLGIEALTAI
ncbi:hypothetical protein [Geobacillus sp. FSL K6-3411]|uniref:hypothetical protein n=1 Tax=Geobacillus sp. FSL K6-3411 TaxID=2954614 RepID=UPI0030D7C5FB